MTNAEPDTDLDLLKGMKEHLTSTSSQYPPDELMEKLSPQLQKLSRQAWNERYLHEWTAAAIAVSGYFSSFNNRGSEDQQIDMEKSVRNKHHISKKIDLSALGDAMRESKALEKANHIGMIGGAAKESPTILYQNVAHTTSHIRSSIEKMLSPGPHDKLSLNQKAFLQGYIDLLFELTEDEIIGIAKIPISCGEWKGITLAHAALTGKDPRRILDILKTGGIDLDAAASEGQFEGCTPLHFAIAFGTLRDIDHLIRNCHVNPNTPINKGLNRGWLPLHFAAGFGKKIACDYLIKKCGLSPYAVTGEGDDEGMSALHIAASNGQVDLINHLVGVHGFEPNAPVLKGQYKGMSPLHLAALKGDMDVADCLIKRGVNPFIVAGEGPYEGNSPLCIATTRGCVEVVDHFIDKYVCDLHLVRGQQRLRGFTLLHIAAAFGQAELFDFVSKKYGFETDTPVPDGPSQGLSPLHIAVAYNQFLFVDHLIDEHGVKPDVLAGDGPHKGLSALHIAAHMGLEAVATHLIKNHGVKPDLMAGEGEGEGLSPIHVAAAEGDVKFVRSLIKQHLVKPGALAGEGRRMGLSALHFAAANGKTQVLDYLITKCEVDANTGAGQGLHEGLTPVYFAIALESEDALKYLSRYVKPKAFISTGPRQGFRPECVALEQEKSIQPLIALNIVEIQEPYATGVYEGLTPLHVAILNGNLQAAKELMAAGADKSAVIKAGTYTGLNAFGLAVASGQAHMLGELPGLEFAVAETGLFKRLELSHLVALSGHNVCPIGHQLKNSAVSSENPLFAHMNPGQLKVLAQQTSIATLYEHHLENQPHPGQGNTEVSGERQPDVTDQYDKARSRLQELKDMAAESQGPKATDLYKWMHSAGWYCTHRTGSHQQWIYNTEKGKARVTLVEKQTRIESYMVKQVIHTMTHPPGNGQWMV